MASEEVREVARDAAAVAPSLAPARARSDPPTLSAAATFASATVSESFFPLSFSCFPKNALIKQHPDSAWRRGEGAREEEEGGE